MLVCVGSYQFEQRSCCVVTARSAARAEFIQMTLAAHGLSATVAVPSVYPSVDFVEGVGVFVQAEDEERARSIIDVLGLATDPAQD